MFPGQLGHIGGVPADVRGAPFPCTGGKDELARPVRCPRFPRVREEEYRRNSRIEADRRLSPCEGGRASMRTRSLSVCPGFPACGGKSPRLRNLNNTRRLSPCAGGEERSPNFYGRAPQFFRIREGKSGPSARSRFHTGFLQGSQSFCRVMLFLLALF